MHQPSKYKLNKRCKKCNKLLLDKNKTGYCNIHRDRTGANNSFYGKSHSKKSIQKIKEKTSFSSKKLWENKEYRYKVIEGVSKPRKASFKKEQSKRVSQWYKDNPKQKELRSKQMKKSWEDGKIISNNFSCNKSKKEKELFKNIQKCFNDAINSYTIKYGKRNWFFPDIFIPSNNIIIEYYGDYWHANPNIYKENDIIHHNITAKQIWENDKRRINKLESLGYKVDIVWETNYKKDKNEIIRKLEAFNWESCAV